MSGDRCPYCDADLDAGPIAEGARHMYGGDRFSRKMGHEIPSVLDGILFWSDSEGCGKAWHRFPEDHPYHQRAVPYVEKHNRRVEERTDALDHHDAP